MLAPKAISSASAPSRSATDSWAATSSASVSRELAKAPPAFALERSRYPLMASITEAGTCEPPGPSK
jgi:hypothetical protein